MGLYSASNLHRTEHIVMEATIKQTDVLRVGYLIQLFPDDVSLNSISLRLVTRYCFWWAFPLRVRVRMSGKLKSGDFEAVRAL